MDRPDVFVLLLAAGSGTRMGSPTAKQRIEILGESVLLRAARAFASVGSVSSITVVTRREDIAFAEEEMQKIAKPTRVIEGGACRAESAKRGFLSLEKAGGYVAVADAARCLVTKEEIEECISAAREYGAASLARQVTDTVKSADPSGMILSTLPRGGLWLASTPQIFRCDLYEQALANCPNLSAVTDDNMLMEAAGIPVKLVASANENIKITYGEDLVLAEEILRRKERTMTRIGHGYDVHRLVPDRKLILGGVEIPYEKGLLGHSDADVLLHAVMDALLGAVGEGDIGRHFPDSDDRYLGISSILLLSEVGKILKAHAARVVNIDVTLVLQSPKVSPFVETMKNNVASALGIAPSRVNVKATTEEHLGFTGSGEGAAAHAVALVEMPEDPV